MVFRIIVTPLGGVHGQSADMGWVGLIECSGCDVICDPPSVERSKSAFPGLGATCGAEVGNLGREEACWSE